MFCGTCTIAHVKQCALSTGGVRAERSESVAHSTTALVRRVRRPCRAEEAMGDEAVKPSNSSFTTPFRSHNSAPGTASAHFVGKPPNTAPLPTPLGAGFRTPRGRATIASAGRQEPRTRWAWRLDVTTFLPLARTGARTTGCCGSHPFILARPTARAA